MDFKDSTSCILLINELVLNKWCKWKVLQRQIQHWDTSPELVALPLVVNKAISQVPGHHKLQTRTCLLLIVHRVHLREPETTV